jgi:hypothetical protein
LSIAHRSCGVVHLVVQLRGGDVGAAQALVVEVLRVSVELGREDGAEPGHDAVDDRVDGADQLRRSLGHPRRPLRRRRARGRRARGSARDCGAARPFWEMLIAGPLIDPASSLPSSSSSSSLLRPAGAVVRLERRTFSAPATSRGLPAPRAPAQCVLCVLCFFYFSPLVKMPYLHFIREGSLIFFRSSGFI